MRLPPGMIRCATTAAGAAGSSCPRFPWVYGTTLAASMSWKTTAPSCAAPLTWASPTSIWPTTTARPQAPLRRLSACCLRRTSALTATSSSSPARPATLCGPVHTASGARANTSCRAATRASNVWGCHTSTSFITTGRTRKRPSKRACRRSTTSCAAGARCTPAFPTTSPLRRVRPRVSCASSARPA
jgi:hypothetical protein